VAHTILAVIAGPPKKSSQDVHSRPSQRLTTHYWLTDFAAITIASIHRQSRPWQELEILMEALHKSVPLRVGVWHHEPIVELGLRATLDAQPGLAIQAGVELGELQQRCEVLVCDFDTAMAFMAAPQSAPKASMLRVLVFTEHMSERHVRQALSQGVHGYVVPGPSTTEVEQAVWSVAAGQRYLSAAVAHRVAESLSYASLTPRETDVLDGLSGGRCNKLIARQLGISVATVKAHVNAIMKKMSAGSRTQVVSVAAQRGLVGLSQAYAHIA